MTHHISTSNLNYPSTGAPNRSISSRQFFSWGFLLKQPPQWQLYGILLFMKKRVSLRALCCVASAAASWTFQYSSWLWLLFLALNDEWLFHSPGGLYATRMYLSLSKRLESKVRMPTWSPPFWAADCQLTFYLYDGRSAVEHARHFNQEQILSAGPHPPCGLIASPEATPSHWR